MTTYKTPQKRREGGEGRTQTSNFPGAKHSGKWRAYVRPPITKDPVVPTAHSREIGKEGWREEARVGGREGEDEAQSR